MPSLKNMSVTDEQAAPMRGRDAKWLSRVNRDALEVGHADDLARDSTPATGSIGHEGMTISNRPPPFRNLKGGR